MNSTVYFGSAPIITPDKNTAAACGLYCGSCGIYLATKENDSEKLLQYAIVLNQSFGETFCDGCRSGRKSGHCSKMCSIMNCTFNKSIEFCGVCPEFPCKELKDFQSKIPHRIEILESQNRLNEIGWEQWLIEMKENYSCPQCNTLNSAYDLACRKCGYSPSCKFALRHKDLINNHLSED
jgi:ribosomal protein L40E